MIEKTGAGGWSMAGAVRTLLSCSCMSIFVLGLLCCPCFFLSSVEFFDGLRIIIVLLNPNNGKIVKM